MMTILSKVEKHMEGPTEKKNSEKVSFSAGI